MFNKELALQQQCPFCGSYDDIEINKVEIDWTIINHYMECKMCNKEWIDIYEHIDSVEKE